ncbi:MAG: hypothetical protein NXI32_26815 [bacterium]|nr:hypothetical protein [bacterium]
MSAYIVETLNATGWKRSNILQFRYQDAMRCAKQQLDRDLVRAVRILAVKVQEDAVYAEEKQAVGAE